MKDNQNISLTNCAEHILLKPVGALLFRSSGSSRKRKVHHTMTTTHNQTCLGTGAMLATRLSTFRSGCQKLFRSKRVTMLTLHSPQFQWGGLGDQKAGNSLMGIAQ